MSAIGKVAVAIGAVALCLAGLLCLVPTLPLNGSNEYGEWVSHKEFLRMCDPARTTIHVWNFSAPDEQHVEYDIPREYVPMAIKKLLDVRLSRWSDAPFDDTEDLHLVIRCGKMTYHIYGWSDRPPYFSRRARSDAGPWFASFAKGK